MFVSQRSPTEVFNAHQGSPPDFDTIEIGLARQVGTNMRVVRSQLGRSQQSLAELIGVSLSQYRKYESGKDLPRLHSALLWSIETGVPTHWLFHDTGYQQWLDVPFNQKWIPILYFVNHAHAWALDAFHAALTGMLNCHGETEALTCLESAKRSLSHEQLKNGYYPAISEKLRQFRHKINLSQDEAAQIFNISTPAYRRYETPDKCTQFSINLIMRFWVATGINPIELSSETGVFHYRQLQRDNFRVLLPLLGQLTARQLEELSGLLEVLERLPAQSRN